jgi:polar amino acid transport system substrate-binding protein
MIRVNPFYCFIWAVIPAAIVFCSFSAFSQERFPDTLLFVDEPAIGYEEGESGELSTGGMAFDLLAELFGRLGAKVETRLFPWSRVLKTAELGKADGVPLLMKSAERELYLTYTIPIVENMELFYYLPEKLGTFAWQDYRDLQGIRIGLVRGYTYGPEFLAAIELYQLNIFYSVDSEQLLDLLLAKRLDVLLGDSSMMAPLLSGRGLTDTVAAATKPVSRYHWYMGISKRSPLIRHIERINKTLQEMKDDGTMREIFKR